MRVNLVAVGDELLDGRVRDVNILNIGRFLAERGLELSGVWVIGDDAAQMAEALTAAAAGAALVLVTGGLGPTEDDRTREVAAQLLGAPLVEDAEALRRIKARFDARGVELTANNRRQALFPQGAAILYSDAGTAAGFAMPLGQAEALFMPGVPREVLWFLDAHVAARVDGEAGGVRQVMTFFGVGESMLETRLSGIEALAGEVGGRVAYCAAFPTIELTLRARDEAGLARLVAFTRESEAARWLIAEGGELLAARVGRLLVAQGMTVTTAESCTAGGIAAALTDPAGSSAWFERAWVTYANAAKVEEVGVQPETLQAFGAVSAATVCQMAAGARERAGASVGLAVSGIAGPGGATPDKPVGTVHFALATADGVWHRHHVFAGRDRAQVRTLSVMTSLVFLLDLLTGRLDVAGRYAPQEVQARVPDARGDGRG